LELDVNLTKRKMKTSVGILSLKKWKNEFSIKFHPEMNCLILTVLLPDLILSSLERKIFQVPDWSTKQLMLKIKIEKLRHQNVSIKIERKFERSILIESNNFPIHIERVSKKPIPKSKCVGTEIQGLLLKVHPKL
jgi:hypothetical protein